MFKELGQKEVRETEMKGRNTNGYKQEVVWINLGDVESWLQLDFILLIKKLNKLDYIKEYIQNDLKKTHQSNTKEYKIKGKFSLLSSQIPSSIPKNVPVIIISYLSFKKLSASV